MKGEYKSKIRYAQPRKEWNRCAKEGATEVGACLHNKKSVKQKRGK